ncbi:phosphoribosylamine--glycine ligase [Robiginitomaculum antarcticum]|uniref:phosphoribosylamine--glycine ligase n=1 Tax=Robiginitomaculum antarcticum TaxID=437507 RepID=UPI0003736EBC|nr:phosphoribosylamine--glycine ligase [Robiginitomaculum antarcticum]
MKTLLLGGGGREHALAWKLSQSDLVSTLYCAPGNPGIADVATCIDMAVDDIPAILAFCKDIDIEFVIVGPEQPLSIGITDALTARGIAVFGPTQDAAQLESSKAFMKDFCARHNIPTARYGVFTDPDKAKAFLSTMEPPYVLKTDGLAAGKGVTIAETLEHAHAELDAYLSGKFGAAGQRVIIEEFMSGEEASFFAVCDGVRAVPLIAAQDHKRVGDGDSGPNTGGMGAYAPAPVFTADIENQVMDKIIAPTMAGMATDGYPFTGVLFAGLMITAGGPKLIEYNIRFGDPECQVIMRMMQSDLGQLLYAAATGKLNAAPAPHFTNAPTVNVVMCAKGYPGRYDKGSMIKGLDAANRREGVMVFHAGTRAGEGGSLEASGGRVLSVTAQAETLAEAVRRAYAAIDEDIDWPEGFCRRDIAWRAL